MKIPQDLILSDSEEKMVELWNKHGDKGAMAQEYGCTRMYVNTVLRNLRNKGVKWK